MMAVLVMIQLITDSDNEKVQGKSINGHFIFELEKVDNVEGFFKDGLRNGLCKLMCSRTNVQEIARE